MLPLIISGGVSLGMAAFKYFQGRSQQRRADSIRQNASDPGFARNQGLIDNADVLRDRYTNYQMPGYSQAVNNVNLSANNAFNQGVQGASSSADVLDLAGRVQQVRQGGLNNIQMTNAQMQDQALMDYLRANEAVGQDTVRVNALQNQRYDQQMAEAAALQQAGATNQYGALNDVASAATTIANTYLTPQWSYDSQGRMTQGDSMFNQWLSKKRGTANG